MRVFVIFLFMNISFSNTINVPSDFSTIQEAITNAVNGDTVLVDPGEYSWVDLRNKDVVVGSKFLTTGDTSYISQTKVLSIYIEFDGHVSGFSTSSFYCWLATADNIVVEDGTGEIPLIYSTIENLTIRNMDIHSRLLIDNTNSKINGLHVYNNRVEGPDAGLINMIGENITIDGMIVENNTIVASSGTLITLDGYGEGNFIFNNVIVRNNSYKPAPLSTILFMGNNFQINNGLFYGNANIMYGYTSDENVILNHVSDYNEYSKWAGGSWFVNSIVSAGESWGTNSMFSDPLYNEDYSLNDSSLAIGAGLDSVLIDTVEGRWVVSPAFDIYGNPRGKTPDLGAIENPLDSALTSTSIPDPPTGLSDGYENNSFNLYQNYPNPFNPTTTIKMSIPKRELVTIQVYNMLGQNVYTLEREMNAGINTVFFDGNVLSSGTYVYSVRVGNFREIKKMVLIK